MNGLLADLAYAARGWLAQPLLLLVAAASLALGIGVNVAIFSVYQQVIMRPLPVSEPQQLVNFVSPGPRLGSNSNNFTGPRDEIFSYPMMADLRAQPNGFSSIAAQRLLSANLAVDSVTRAGQGLMVSGNYFKTLRLKPALGRLFVDEDEGAPGQNPVAVLSHRYWQDRLGSSPAILGKAIKINGELLTVVGIAPEGFDGSAPGQFVDVFVPINMRWRLEPQPVDADDRSVHWVYLFGRLADGVDRERAEAVINPLYQRLIKEVELPRQQGLDATTLAQFGDRRLQLVDGSRGQSSLARIAAPAVVVLWAVSALVLLIACMNIANILLARGAARSAELSVRASLGASPARLRRQLLSEATALGALGLLLSVPVAMVALAAVPSMMPDVAKIQVQTGMDWQALAFAAVIAGVTVLMFGLLPAWQLARTQPIDALRGAGSKAVGRVAARFRSVLATSQVAISMVVLVMAGLFTQSLMNLSDVDPGMEIDSVASFAIAPERNGYSKEQSAAMYQELEQAFREQPGILHVATSLVPLLSGSDWGRNVNVEGFKTAPGVDTHAFYNVVGPAFLDTLGIPLLSGRGFEPGDREGAPQVAIVNRAFAEKFGFGDAAVGKRINFGDSNELNIEIVGLINTVSYSSLREQNQEQFFIPRAQSNDLGQMTFYLRGAMSADALLKRVLPVVTEVDPDLPVESLQTFQATVQQSTMGDRLMSKLAAGFAALATALAAIGLYGVVSYTLAQRTRELGLRLALGAEPKRLRNMVLRQTAHMAAVGAALGLLLALLAGRAVQSMLFGIEAHDPAILLAATSLLGIVALISAALPAQRASRIDPMEALRHD